jgi:predicted amidohydrolase
VIAWLLLLALAAPVRAASSETLTARVVSWDVGWRPDSADAWTAAVSSEVARAAEESVDVLIFPELFAWGLAPFAAPGEDATEFIGRRWRESVMPAVARAAPPAMLVALGTYPHRERGAAQVYNRGMVLHDGRWTVADKLDPTQPETRETPPIKPGATLPLLSFRGGTAAVAVCFSLEKPEIAVALKRAGVQLLLAPSATEDEDGVARVLRSASARAVELGAAVLVAPLLGEQDGWRNRGSAALYLPAQKGIAHAPQESPRRDAGTHSDDFIIPWAKLLALRVQAEKPETRPFLAPTPPFRVERR